MYDLPKGTTFEFLRDRELELLCFGPYTVTLHFGGGIQLQIEGSFTHITMQHGVAPEASHFPLSESQLMRLLLQRVTQVAAKQNGTLTLRFGNGDTLVIDGNIGPYESYNVNHPDGLLVV
jgi:Family of unknown function (DUF6188)